MSRSSLSRSPADRAVGLLELVELLIAEESPEGCAGTTLEWLARSLDVERSFCAVVSSEHEALIGLAGLGVSGDDVAAIRVAVSERNHPLVLALASREPVSFSKETRGVGQTPFGDTPFVAVPVASRGEEGDGGDEVALGLVCLGTDALVPAAAAEASWAAKLLAVRLASLWYSETMTVAERRRLRTAWLNDIVDVVSDPIVVSDADGRTLLANRSAEYLLSSEAVMSEGRRRAVALNNMLFSACLFGMQDGEGGRREVLLVDPVEGEDLLFELLTHQLEHRPGEYANVSVLRNVTDLQRAVVELEENYLRLRAAEARTREERDRLELILGSTVDPILVTDSEGKIELMNPPAERLFTTDSTDSEAERRMQGNDAVLSSVLSKLYAGASERLRDQLALTDPVSGESVPVEAIATRVVSPKREDTAVVTVLHDLTETMEKAALYEKVKEYSEKLEDRVREATAELAEQNELLRRQALELEHASAMKSRFLANASHELRTPLNAIIGHTQIMLEGIAGELTPRQIEKLDRLDSNANHLMAIINDLLDITRIEAGKLPVEIERFALRELVDEVITELEPLVPTADVELSRDLPPGLPDLESDRQKIKQIVSNLLSNALKFTAAGKVAIEARYEADGDLVQLAVSDTGSGIPEDQQQTIFDPFGQSETSFRPIQKGTGLGLSICRRLASLLGGQITVDSVVGEGSTFTVELPRRLAEGER